MEARLETGYPRHRTPWVTWLLIVLMGGIYLFSLAFGLPYESVVEYGLVPEHPSLVGLLGALFLHAGGYHLLYNAALLWLFGRDVENRVGSWYFLLLYLVGGFAANLVQIGAVRLFLPTEMDLPIIGASGAVAMVIGAYAGLFPYARTVLRSRRFRRPLAFRFAWVWGTWLALQGLGILWNLLVGIPQETGYWGHAAGFMLGAAIGMSGDRLLPRPRLLEDDEDGGGYPAHRLSARESRWLANLKDAVERREDESAWLCYRRLLEEHSLSDVPPGLHLEFALLMENEGRTAVALEALQRVARCATPDLAADALLALARLFARSLHDSPRAEETLKLLQAQYSQTPAALLALAEWKRLHPTGS